MAKHENPETLMEKGHYDKAAALLKRKIQLSKKKGARDLNLLGVCEARLGLIESARKSFLKAIFISPRSAASLNNLGNLSFLEGDFASARDYYLRSLRESVWATEPRYNLILTYQRLGLAEQALSTYCEMLIMNRMKKYLYVALIIGCILMFYVLVKR